MSLRLSKYLTILKAKASSFERTDINGSVDESFRAKYLMKVVFGIISGILVFFLKNGFSGDFVSYASSVLSILVGLFITALIFSFDKFYHPQDNLDTADSQIKLWDKQAYNYAKKFAYITSYTIVLSIFTLAFLAVNALFKEETTLNFFSLRFDFKHIDIESVKLFCIAAFLIIQRFFVLYWLLKIMYNTLFIVSSMVQYMITKIDR